MRILINLYFKLYRALYYPLHLLFKRSFGLIVLLALGYFLVKFVFNEPAPTRADPNFATLPKQAPIIHEDGNSAFASDLLNQMPKEALQHYSQAYHWVMTNQPAGTPYDWIYMDSHGTLTPSEPFKNNLGHVCRRFSETLKVGETQQTLDGIACQKKGGGWCKLGKTFTPVCGLAPDTGISAWFKRLF